MTIRVTKKFGRTCVFMVAMFVISVPVPTRAQITGTYVDALPVDEGGNTVETDTGDEGGFYTGPQAEWANPVPGPQVPFWHISAADGGLDEDGQPGRRLIENVAWYDHSDAAPGITTTITGLLPGGFYDIRVIFPAVTHTTHLIGIDAAFKGEDFRTFHQENSRDTSLVAGGVIFFEGLIGTTQATEAGEIYVDIAVASELDPVSGKPFARNMYDGLSYILAGDACDFDGSGSLDLGDIDRLVSAIGDGNQQSQWDVNADLLVDVRDLHFFVTDAEKLNTYVGDVNLDGEFNSGDLVLMFQGGRFEENIEATWLTGDLNADGKFNTSDLVAAFQDGGFEKGPKGVAAVPEHTSVGVLWICLLGSMRCLRRHRQISTR